MEKSRNDILEKAFEYVDTYFDQMLEELKGICSYRSVSTDCQGIKDTVDFIINKMDQLGLEVSRYDVKDGNPLLLGWKQGESDKTLMFYNHYDVVTEGALERWDSNPYKPEIRDGRIWARGISDNKGPLICRLHAYEALRSACDKLPVSVKFFSEGDEEALSVSMKKFIEENPEQFKEITRADAVIWENSRNDERDRPWASFGVGGEVGIELSVKSVKEDAHARMGVILPNSAWRLVWALASLKDAEEHILVEHFYDKLAPVSEADRQVLEAFPYEEDEIRERYGIDQFLLDKTGYELKERIYTQPSLTICGIDAGEAANGLRGVVPCFSKAKLSCRLMMDQSADEIAQLIRDHLVKQGFGDIEVTITDSVSPVRTSPDIPLRKCLEECAALVYEDPLVIELAQLGAGPAMLFRQAWQNVPIVGIGPGNTGSAHHAPNENLYLEHYRKAVKMNIALMLNF